MLKTIVCKNSMEHSLQYIVQGILCNLQKYNLCNIQQIFEIVIVEDC